MDTAVFTARIMPLIRTLEERSERHTAQSAFVHLVEEIGEIARQLTNKEHRPEKYDPENLGAELADALMFLVLVAERSNIDLPVEMEKAIGRLEAKITKA